MTILALAVTQCTEQVTEKPPKSAKYTTFKLVTRSAVKT